MIKYKTRKAEEDLLFARKQMDFSKAEFERAQNRLSEFRDRNLNLTTATSQIQLQRLQSEYDLSFNVYSTLAQQVEQAKIKLQEQTPVVSILHPVHVPVEDETSGLLILVGFIVFFIFVSVSWLVVKKLFLKA